MPPNNKAKLEDIISYTPESYFTQDDLALLRSHFNGPQGLKLLQVIRKAVLPTISDPNLPIEELGKDIWMSAVDFKQMQESEVKPTVLGLQVAVKVLVGSLIQLRDLANVKEETATERALREKRNSSR